MKMTVIVSSPQFLNTAGSRIRYQRLHGPLSRAHCQLSITTISDLPDFDMNRGDNVYLFSKVHDARGLALARQLRAEGGIIGVDLFDDYFSQVDDARFAAQRLWLTEIACFADFFLCSTERMKQVASRYFKNTAGHVLNDPFDRFEPQRLGAAIESKRRKAVDTATIEMLWFGIGENPNFPVGLHDLAYFGTCLHHFRRLGFALNLKVLTNDRALTPAGLTLLKNLQVEPVVREWSVEREAALLESSLVSFLPVNGQGFSAAKSLNRAVTAVTAGTQVLTAGYPLYHALSSFIYRHPASLVDDIRSGAMLTSEQTLPALGATLAKISDPETEARSLHAFLLSVIAHRQRAYSSSEAPIAILHGAQSTGVVDKLARRYGWLSLGTPFTPIGPTYDAHLAVFERGGKPCVRLTKAVRDRLVDDLGRKAKPLSTRGRGLAFEIGIDQIMPGAERLIAGMAQHEAVASHMAMHRQVMEVTRQVYRKLLGPMQFVVSERNPALCHAAEMASLHLRANS